MLARLRSTTGEDASRAGAASPGRAWPRGLALAVAAEIGGRRRRASRARDVRVAVDERALRRSAAGSVGRAEAGTSAASRGRALPHRRFGRGVARACTAEVNRRRWSFFFLTSGERAGGRGRAHRARWSACSAVLSPGGGRRPGTGTSRAGAASPAGERGLAWSSAAVLAPAVGVHRKDLEGSSGPVDMLDGKCGVEQSPKLQLGTTNGGGGDGYKSPLMTEGISTKHPWFMPSFSTRRSGGSCSSRTWGKGEERGRPASLNQGQYGAIHKYGACKWA